MKAQWLDISSDEEHAIGWTKRAYADPETGRILATVQQDEPGGTWEATVKTPYRREEFLLREQAEKYVEGIIPR